MSSMFLVCEANWEYNDETYDHKGTTPKQAFGTRKKAEKAWLKLMAERLSGKKLMDEECTGRCYNSPEEVMAEAEQILGKPIEITNHWSRWQMQFPTLEEVSAETLVKLAALIGYEPYVIVEVPKG